MSPKGTKKSENPPADGNTEITDLVILSRFPKAMLLTPSTSRREL